MLYISYHGIVVKSAKTRRYDCGIYITSAKFTISGKAAAVYAEPKELSGFPYNGPAIMPVVTFASEEAEAAILQAASCWSAEHPLSAEGRADKLSPAMKMLSDLAWTKVLYDNAEKDYKAYRHMYPDNTDNGEIVVFLPCGKTGSDGNSRETLTYLCVPGITPEEAHTRWKDAQAWIGTSEWARKSPRDIIHSR